MFLTVKAPFGEVHSIALTDIPAWTLELRATRYHQQKPEVEVEGQKDEPKSLAVGFTFIVDGAKVFQPVAAIDLLTTNGEVGSIASHGLVGATPALVKEHLRGQLNMLHNGAEGPAASIDDLIAKASQLADIHAAILKALWSTPTNIDKSGDIVLKGEFERWSYALTRTRFEPVFTSGSGGAEGMGAAPGFEVAYRPPPPTEKGASKRRAPVLTAATAPSAEAQAEKAEAEAPPPGTPTEPPPV